MTFFPHFTGELVDYAEYIIALFSATDILFHDWVILLTRLSTIVLTADMILSSLISTNSLTLELHTWIQLVQLLYNALLSPRYPQLHTRIRKHATDGTRGCACLMAASANWNKSRDVELIFTGFDSLEQLGSHSSLLSCNGNWAALSFRN